jgi:hypothetical protein
MTPVKRIAVALTAPVLATFGLVAAATSAQAAATCTTTAQYGSCAEGAYTVQNDEWDMTAGSSQTLTVTGAGNWQAVTSQPSGTYVRSYPDVYQNLPGNPISSYNTLVQTFTDSVSYSSGTGETAADDWFNGNPSTSLGVNANTVEVMVWTDNNGHTPAGNDTTTATINGQNFAVWECSSANCGHIIYTFELQGTQETSGQIHLVNTMLWLENQGLVPGSLPADQLSYGAEFGDLNHTTNATLTVTRYNDDINGTTY